MRRSLSFRRPESSQERRLQRRQGSILVLTLWLLFLFSLLAAQASWRVRQDHRFFRRDEHILQSYYAARTGLHAAWDAFREARSQASGIEGMAGWARDDRPDGGVVRYLEWEDAQGRPAGACLVRVQDEHSFLPVLAVGRETLKRFAGSFSRKAIERRDEGDPVPEEVLAAGRGVEVLQGLFVFDEEAFHGEDTDDNFLLDPWEDDGDDRPPPDNADHVLDLGAKGFATVWTDGTVNVNTAPPEVLRVLPGMSADVLEAVLAARQRQPLAAPGDLAGLAPVTDAVFAQLASWAAFSTDVVRVTVTGRGAGSPFVYTLTAVTDISSGVPRVLWWREGSASAEGRWVEKNA